MAHWIIGLPGLLKTSNETPLCVAQKGTNRNVISVFSGYCMIEIAQMALSYYLNKQQKDCLLRHHGQNDPESPARARSAICRTVKSFQMIQTRVGSMLKHVTQPGDFLWITGRGEFNIVAIFMQLAQGVF